MSNNYQLVMAQKIVNASIMIINAFVLQGQYKIQQIKYVIIQHEILMMFD